MPLAPAATSVGVLNFQITQLMLRYVKEQGLSYASISSARAAAFDAAAELNRRIGAPYEDQKIRENGDVYEELIKELARVRRS